MRFLSTVLVSAFLLGCSSSISDVDSYQFDGSSPDVSQAPSPTPLIVLSGGYGLCVGGRYVRERWKTFTHNDQSIAKVMIQDESGSHELVIDIGWIDTTHLKLQTATVEASGREVRTGHHERRNYLVTSFVSPSGITMVSINFDDTDVSAESIANDLIRELVLCETRARPAHATFEGKSVHDDVKENSSSVIEE